MCGIAGIVNLKQHKPISSDALRKMVSIQKHRGPDETGAYIDDNIGLAHARLSIIDLKDGTQPIHNEDKSLWIIYNGEVFNYPELRQELVRRGHKFYTSSDTEVILHLYEDKGINCLKELNGQFAFAIWDSNNRTLFLARDRVGILPLYYTIQNQRLYFASEIKAIFTNKEIHRALDSESLDQVFTFWTTLPGKTVFNNIKELPPAHYMLISPNEIKYDKYWDLNFANNKETVNRLSADLVNEISELMMDAVRIRLRADVPVGTYLSGGIDSSALTETVKKNFNNELRSFGIRFENKDYDEGKFQNEMVDYLNINHSEIVTRNEDIGANLEEVLWHSEKPLLRTGPIPLYLLSKLVNQSGYKVVLTGEGADEVFGGYDIFKEAKIRDFWAKDPDSKLRPMLLARLYPYIFKDNRLNQTIVSFFKDGIDNPEDPFFSHNIRWKNTSKIKNFFSEQIKNSNSNYNSYSELLKLLPVNFFDWDVVTKAQFLEAMIFLSNYLLSSQGDRVAMANSVELRVPYLDHRVIELLAKVNSEIKINGLNEKYLLKQVFKNRLPSNILKRWKNPYRAPINKALLNNNLNLAKDYCSEDSLKRTGIFDHAKVLRLINKLGKLDKAGEFDEMALIGIISTQIIHKNFIDSFPNEYAVSGTFDQFFDYRSVNEELTKVI
ncbi:MAG: asparagine synthase (glutamine-hydrolyzing) [Ignavibacteriota bacterium]|nr:asparagine synthase (glutamine-hydrolyzing) [Ignavibacteriales bacterium]MBL1122292.1 asparagine synthase (glutamine-hydrolyzing) [Ignavibacteriota bacterium]MCC7093523.1 asparagine synthase (glutamine-hydrolyzing) [Ignavibacteriaceae bacterium]MCE7854926.1 asparagine synthase (glutamine-hydrolyzing) [Ignavibacteria bacterium CHB3]QKJ95417.1 MAG: asparagine synthase (glutamine-hydrolyzing) [Ignavibacteriota bacterium]